MRDHGRVQTKPASNPRRRAQPASTGLLFCDRGSQMRKSPVCTLRSVPPNAAPPCIRVAWKRHGPTRCCGACWRSWTRLPGGPRMVQMIVVLLVVRGVCQCAHSSRPLPRMAPTLLLPLSQPLLAASRRPRWPPPVTPHGRHLRAGCHPCPPLRSRGPGHRWLPQALCLATPRLRPRSSQCSRRRSAT